MAHLSFAAAHLLLALSIGLSQAQTCFTSDYVIANDGDEYMRLNSTGLYACGGTAICPTLVVR